MGELRYTVRIRTEVDKIKYKHVISDLLTVLFPYDIKYGSEYALKEYVTWAIEATSEIEGIKFRKDIKENMLKALNEVSGEKLRNFICNMILSGEGMSHGRFNHVKY